MKIIGSARLSALPHGWTIRYEQSTAGDHPLTEPPVRSFIRLPMPMASPPQPDNDSCQRNTQFGQRNEMIHWRDIDLCRRLIELQWCFIGHESLTMSCANATMCSGGGTRFSARAPLCSGGASLRSTGSIARRASPTRCCALSTRQWAGATSNRSRGNRRWVTAQPDRHVRCSVAQPQQLDAHVELDVDPVDLGVALKQFDAAQVQPDEESLQFSLRPAPNS